MEFSHLRLGVYTLYAHVKRMENVAPYYIIV